MDTYIWVNRWDEFQTFQVKKGKPWVPPWIKLYPRLLTDADFIGLRENEQLLLLKLFMLFSSTRQLVPNSTRTLSRLCGQRVMKMHIDSLNHAGWIDICSRTVLERRRNQFWKSSALEVEEEVEEDTPLPNRDLDHGLGRAGEENGNIEDIPIPEVMLRSIT